MFERFDDAARRVIVLADAEARGLSHHSIDTGHLLLGLLRESDGAAARALTGLGIGYDAVHARVAESGGRSAEPVPEHMPFTDATKQSLQSCFEESLRLRNKTIGTEHILLGLVREENDATRMLADMGADAQRVRDQVLG